VKALFSIISTIIAFILTIPLSFSWPFDFQSYISNFLLSMMRIIAIIGLGIFIGLIIWVVKLAFKKISTYLIASIAMLITAGPIMTLFNGNLLPIHSYVLSIIRFIITDKATSFL
jgi:hypothetical protein